MLRSLSLVLSLPSLLLLGILVLGDVDRTAGAGAIDQTLTGDPDCSYDALQGVLGTIGPLQQEFVPGMSTLTGVDVCIVLHAPAEEPALDINIRRGAVASPSTIIAARSVDGPANLQWLHVEFDPFAVVPGERLVLEVSGRFGWQSTCPVGAGTCDHVDPDLYPNGVSDYAGADFGFRTYGNNDPAPEPGPPPLNVQWGNLDCSQSATGADALIPLAIAAGVTPPQPVGTCPALGQNVTVFGRARQWGDVDCLNLGPARDALALITALAGYFFPYQRDVACPGAGQLVNVNY